MRLSYTLLILIVSLALTCESVQAKPQTGPYVNESGQIIFSDTPDLLPAEMLQVQIPKQANSPSPMSDSRAETPEPLSHWEYYKQYPGLPQLRNELPEHRMKVDRSDDYIFQGPYSSDEKDSFFWEEDERNLPPGQLL
jgi:hypothetical protein